MGTHDSKMLIISYILGLQIEQLKQGFHSDTAGSPTVIVKYIYLFYKILLNKTTVLCSPQSMIEVS